MAIIEAPSWLSLDEFTLSGTPTSDDIGLYEISLSVSDGVDVVAESFELVVDEFNDPPITSNLNFIIDGDSSESLEGASIDYVEDVMQQGFKIEAPNAPQGGGGGGGCGCGGGGH